MKARTKITTAQRIERAMQRVDNAIAELNVAAFKVGTYDRGTWDDGRSSVRLYEAARDYAKAVNALARSVKA